MDFSALRWILLVLVVMLQVGCATAESGTDDPANDLVPASAHDDSHGWGTNIQNTSR